MRSHFFTLDEFCQSQTAVRKGIDNRPDKAAADCLEALVDNILHPLRIQFGAPILISSGYRSPKLNKAVGGSATSQHCFGQAADIHVHGVKDIVVARWIEDNLPFDQLILEFPPEGWVHVSYSERHRRQTLTATRGKLRRTIYVPGLHP